MIAGLILAAGAGTRFGEEPKLLAPLDGRPLVEYAIRAQSDVDELEPIVVVLARMLQTCSIRSISGGAAHRVRGLEHGPGCFPAMWSAGARGSRQVDIVTLGDSPLVTPAIITRFIDEPAARGRCMVDRGTRSCWKRTVRALATLSGDQGARDSGTMSSATN